MTASHYVARARGAVVADRDWLHAVERHHEQEDGSGYPTGFAARQSILWENSAAVITAPMTDFFVWVDENYMFETLIGPNGLAVYRLDDD